MKSKIFDKVEAEAFNEGLNAYKKWRQTAKNGILPIGASEVGKTTLLSRFDVAGPNLFMDFNRTLSTKVDSLRLRKEFISACQGVEYVKKIDVPGELPEEWAAAYYDNNPRVLVIMIDDRDHKEHIARINKFIDLLKKGPSLWQQTKTVVNGRWNNLTRVMFVVNKADKINKNELENFHAPYKQTLANIHSYFGVNIQIFKLSLKPENAEVIGIDDFFAAILDSFSRK